MRHEIVSVNPDIEARFYLSIDSGSYVPPHWHDSLELVYMIEGTMTVIFENHREVLHSGEFNIVNSRVIHSVLSEKNKALVLQIPKEILRKFIPNIELYTFSIVIFPSAHQVQSLFPVTVSGWMRIMHFIPLPMRMGDII